MRVVGGETADLEGEPCYEEELISQRNFRGGALAWAAQILLLITAFVGNGILSAAQAASTAVVKPAVSGFAKAWRWSRSSMIGRVIAEAAAFFRKTALRLFWGVWGRQRCRFRRIRRWIVAPTLALALLAAPISGVAELLTTGAALLAYKIGTAFIVGILSSAAVEIGARNYDEKMRKLNGHLVWTTKATGEDAEPTWMQQRDSWLRFLPEEDFVSVATSKSAFMEPKLPDINPERPVSEIFFRSYPIPVNLVGYTLETYVKSDGSPVSSSPNSRPNHSWYGPRMGWGGETEKDMEKYDKLIQKIHGDGWIHDPGKKVIHNVRTWHMSQQISVKSEFEFYRNNNLFEGKPPAPINDLSDPGVTSTYPCNLRYEIVKVGYGVWADENNDGIEEWHDKIYYGDHVAWVDEAVEMHSFKDSENSLISEETVGVSQGIERGIFKFNDYATRHLKKVKVFKCKYLTLLYNRDIFTEEYSIRLRDLYPEVLELLTGTIYGQPPHLGVPRLKCSIPENLPQDYWKLGNHTYRECGGVKPREGESNHDANFIKTELIVVQEHSYTPPAGKKIHQIN